MTTGIIERKLFLINQKINQACKLYKKNKPNLVAVSKMQDSEKILQAIEAGCSSFGENYIKEAEEKWPEIREKFPKIKLHFIGHLQSNKAKNAVKLFDVIESLDSEKLAIELKKEIEKQKKNIEIFIQVNIGEEEQKSGVLPHELKNFVKFSREECGLNITGLMCIPPENESPAPYFALLNKLAKENNLKNLSMGMSSDFEDAIALGSTHIRIGTAIFGKRE
ncbi:MAG: YggS family pyridoxal phosphate-dependent enzyme [Rickettsiales bacterium]|nr:YggS family pyridoxal phosphate-dependent enzyme [Rickettsiales bacterium]